MQGGMGLGNPAMRGGGFGGFGGFQGNPAMRGGTPFGYRQNLGGYQDQGGSFGMQGSSGGSNGAFDPGGLTNANSGMYSSGPMMNGSSPGSGIANYQTGGQDVYNAPSPSMFNGAARQTGGNDVFTPRTPILTAPGDFGGPTPMPKPGLPSNMSLGGMQSMGNFGGGSQGLLGSAPPTGGPDVFNQPSPVQTPTFGQSMGLSPSDPRYNLKEGDQYAGGVITRGPDGRLSVGANNMSGPLAGTSYGQYINPTGGGGIGNINGHNLIFGNEYHGEGLNQDNGTMNPNSGFNVFLRQQAAAMNANMPNDPRTQQINQYLAQLGQGGGAPTPMPKINGGNPALGGNRYFGR